MMSLAPSGPANHHGNALTIHLHHCCGCCHSRLWPLYPAVYLPIGQAAQLSQPWLIGTAGARLQPQSVGSCGFKGRAQGGNWRIGCACVQVGGIAEARGPRFGEVPHGSAGGPQVGQVFQGQEREEVLSQGFLQGRVYQEHGVCRRMLGAHHRRQALR